MSAAKSAEELTKAVADLPFLGPKECMWHVIVHKLRVWAPMSSGKDGASGSEAAEEDVNFVRPFLILVVSMGDNTFLSTEAPEGESSANVLCLEDWPTPEQVSTFVKRVMLKPQALNSSQKGVKARKGGRPKRILFAHTPSSQLLRAEPAQWVTADVCPYVAGCRESMKEVGIEEISFAPVPDFVMQARSTHGNTAALTNVIRNAIEGPMTPPEAWGTAQLPGLDDVAGFTDRFGVSLFGAAAAFHAAAPWEVAPPRTPLRVSYRIQLKPEVFARVNAFVVMSGGKKGEGEEEGDPIAVSIYKNLEQAASSAAWEDTGDADRPQGGQSCVFVAHNEMPFADMDMIEASDAEYEVADAPESFPLFTRVEYETNPQGRPVIALGRPSIFELQSFEVALRALTNLAADGSLARIAAAAKAEAATGGAHNASAPPPAKSAGAEAAAHAHASESAAVTEVTTLAATEPETVSVEVEICETAAVAAMANGVKDLYL